MIYLYAYSVIGIIWTALTILMITFYEPKNEIEKIEHWQMMDSLFMLSVITFATWPLIFILIGADALYQAFFRKD